MGHIITCTVPQAAGKSPFSNFHCSISLKNLNSLALQTEVFNSFLQLHLESFLISFQSQHFSETPLSQPNLGIAWNIFHSFPLLYSTDIFNPIFPLKILSLAEFGEISPNFLLTPVLNSPASFSVRFFSH